MSTLLQDNFTDTNGTALASHTMDVGSGWTSLVGTCTIQSNAAAFGGTGQQLHYADDGANADGTLSASVTTATSDAYYGLAARLLDGNNHWLIAVVNRENTFAVVEVNAASYTQRASTSFTTADNTAYALVATLSGTTISGTVNGGSSISYGSASFQQTKTRMGGANGAGAIMDTFLYTGAAAGSTITTSTLPGGVGCMGSGQTRSIQPAGLSYMG